LKKFSLLLIITLLLATFMMSGCANAEQRSVFSSIHQYVKLMNAEDAAGVYSITHQSVRSIGYKNELDLQFGLYDIKFTIEELKFDKIENGYAYVPFVATMKKNDDSDFKDIRIHGTFVLSKEGDDWKILGMTYDAEKDVEYLEK
jgi:hypothetical protein